MITKFLIIRFSSIGDIVLTSPVIRCIKQQFEGEAEIHFITKNKFTFLVKHNPYISKVYGIKEKVSEVKEELKRIQYDYVIDLHNNIRSSQVKSIVNAPALTFNKLNFEKWLKVNLKVDRLPKQHIVDRYLAPLSPFDIKYDDKGLDYFLPKKHNLELNNWGISENNYTVLSLGGTYFTKRLPKEKILELIPQLKKKVVLIGGKEDLVTANEIAKQSTTHPINLAGKISLHESAFVISKANSVIANDTGMMHIAAAFKKHLASVWGNTVQEFGMYPLLPKKEAEKSKIFEIEKLNCRPCSKLGYDKCPKKHFKCMMDLEMGKVAAFVNS